MLTVQCIQKLRNNHNKIICYKLLAHEGNIKYITPMQLKTAIKNNRINVINLTLTSDNRLVSIKPTQQPEQKNKSTSQKYSLLTRKIVEQINKPKALKFKSNQNLEALESKAKILGYETTRLSEDFLSIENNIKISLVSNKQIQLDDTLITIEVLSGLFQRTKFISIDFHNTDTSNVTNMSLMFDYCEAQSLDLSSFNTSNVTNMQGMFHNCQAKTLDLSSFDTSKVTTMHGMFYECKAQILNLSSFDTSKVTTMCGMFYECKAQTLDIYNFNTSNVNNMSDMFALCKVQNLNLSNFDTSNVINMSRMFFGCSTQIINLSSFNTIKVKYMSDMFSLCKAKDLDLSSFKVSNTTYIDYIFNKCEAQIKTTDPILLGKIK